MEFEYKEEPKAIEDKANFHWVLIINTENGGRYTMVKCAIDDDDKFLFDTYFIVTKRVAFLANKGKGNEEIEQEIAAIEGKPEGTGSPNPNGDTKDHSIKDLAAYVISSYFLKKHAKEIDQEGYGDPRDGVFSTKGVFSDTLKLPLIRDLWEALGKKESGYDAKMFSKIHDALFERNVSIIEDANICLVTEKIETDPELIDSALQDYISHLRKIAAEFTEETISIIEQSTSGWNEKLGRFFEKVMEGNATRSKKRPLQEPEETEESESKKQKQDQ